MSEHKPACRLQKYFQPLFSSDSPAAANLTALLSPNYNAYRPVNLSSCSASKTQVLAYASPHARATSSSETWSKTYGLRGFPAASDGAPPVQFLRGLLVGTLDGDAKGALRIATKLFPAGVQVVIAPPPGPELCDRSVWIQDWRFVPSRLFSNHHHSEGLFEVLLKDVVPLQPREASTERAWTKLSPNLELDPSRKISFCGMVQAKSCMVSARRTSSVCFLVEIVQESAEPRIGTMIVFRGSAAMKWWPFVSAGRVVGVTGLSLSALPSFDHKVVLKASGSDIYVVELPPDAKRSHSTHPAASASGQIGAPTSRKRSQKGLQLLDYPSKRRRTNASAKGSLRTCLITYEGEVTNVLSDGRFELDGKVVLHLGGFNGSCAGPGVSSLCFRRGARIEAYWVLAVARPDRRVSLLPTGRTLMNVLYFGGLKVAASSRSYVRWDRTPWLWLWKRWNFLDVLWAEDVFESLALKFKSWLTDGTSNGASQASESDTMELVRYLLGSRKTTGLVQFVMHIISNRDDLLETKPTAARNLFAEFMEPLSFLPADIEGRFPTIISIKDINRCIGLLWKDATNKRITKYESVHHTPSSSTSCVFHAADVNGKHRPKAEDAKAESWRVEDLVIIGLLQGSSTGDGQLLLTDCTGSIQVQTVGRIHPYILGAMICIKQFSFSVESSQLHSATQTTLIFDPCDAIVVIDGPCVEMKPNETEGKGTPGVDKNGPKLSSQGQDFFRKRLTQNFSQSLSVSVPETQANGDTLVIDTPLVCVFVDRVMAGVKEQRVTGRLIAVARSREENVWESLVDERNRFWKCALRFSGDSALQVCPVLQEHKLFSISCTTLAGVRNPAAFLVERTRLQSFDTYVVQLETCLQSVFPWIEDLGHGFYMRFKSTSGGERAGKVMCGRDHAAPPMSEEGAQYVSVIDAIEMFISQAVSIVQKSLWKAYAWRSISEAQDDQMMTLSGVVEDFSEVREYASSSANVNFVADLVIRDEVVYCFTVTVRFYNSATKPKGIRPGMKVILHDVIRVPQQNYRRFDFVACRDTSVRVVGVEKASDKRTVCLRCVIPREASRFLERVQKDIPLRHTWDFSRVKEAEAQASCTSGIIRFHVSRVERIEVFLSDDTFECGFCATADEFNERWNVGMSVIVAIDDGSSVAELRCWGFRKCARLLGATEREVVALKAVALAFRRVGIEVGAAKEALKRFNVREAGEVGEHLLAVYEFVCRQRGESNVGVVLNQTKMAETLPRTVEIEEVEMKMFYLGYGRKLATATAPCLKVVLECVALCSECQCGRDEECRCRDNGVLRTIDSLRLFLACD